MDKKNKITETNDQITLTLEDDTELTCDVISIFPVNDKNYIALLPVGDDKDAEIFLYGFAEKENDEFDLINIEDDDEFEAVSDAFDELLDEEDFDSMFDEEDDEESEETTEE